MEVEKAPIADIAFFTSAVPLTLPPSQTASTSLSVAQLWYTALKFVKATLWNLGGANRNR